MQINVTTTWMIQRRQTIRQMLAFCSKEQIERYEGELAMLDEIDKLRGIVHRAAEKLQLIVCTEGDDTGVVMLSGEGGSHYDARLECRVYDHLYFSPLGDALVDLHRILSEAQ